jgi:cellulose synthase operon protein C
VLDGPILANRLGARFVQLAARTTPLLLALPERTVQRVEIVAPEGLVPSAAPPRGVEGAFGSFSRTERLEGQTLVREDRLELSRARIAPEQYPEFAGFAAAVDAIEELPATLAARSR